MSQPDTATAPDNVGFLVLHTDSRVTRHRFDNDDVTLHLPEQFISRAEPGGLLSYRARRAFESNPLADHVLGGRWFGTVVLTANHGPFVGMEPMPAEMVARIEERARQLPALARPRPGDQR